jgi:hypothetical protein
MVSRCDKKVARGSPEMSNEEKAALRKLINFNGALLDIQDRIRGALCALSNGDLEGVELYLELAKRQTVELSEGFIKK